MFKFIGISTWFSMAWCVAVFANGTSVTTIAVGPVVPDPSQYYLAKETAHFSVFYQKNAVLSPTELVALSQVLESGYTKVSEYLGPSKAHPEKFIVLLEGEAYGGGNIPHYPSVDQNATIHLYRFPGIGAGYLQGLPHELVHAFRQQQNALHDHLGDFLTGFGFIEEAFAEYVATTVDPTNISFPRYGFSLEIAAGNWLSTQRDIPLKVLFDHHEINPKCVGQAYPLRASFFKFLNEQYGKDQLLQLSYYENTYTQDIFKKIYRKDFGVLIENWRKWALGAFDSLPNNSNILKDYLTQTPIAYFPVCQSGKDW